MRMATEVVCPGTLLLGEVVMEPSKVVPYFGTVEKPECQMLYNVTTMASTWHTVATRDVRLLKHQLSTVFALPKQYTFLNYLRCHDDIGWGLDYDFLKQFGIEEVAHKKYLNDYLKGAWYGSDSRGELYNDDPKLGDARLCGTTASLCGIEAAEYEKNDGKLARAIRLDLMLHAFLFTQSGIPVLYSGDEVGQLNDYTYHDDPLKRDDSRYLHRGNLKWEDVAKRNDPSTRPGKLFAGITRLAKLRRSFDVFDSQADAWIVETWNDHVLGIGRYYKGQKLIALFNFSEFDQTAWVNEQEDYYDMLTGQKRPARAVGIPAYDCAWLLTSFNTAGNPVQEEVRGEKRMAKIGENFAREQQEKKAASAKKTAKTEKAEKVEKAEKPAKAARKRAAKKTEAAKADTDKKTVVKADTKKKPAAKADTEKKPAAKADTEKKPVVKADTEKKSVVKADTEKKPVVKADTEKKTVVKADTQKKTVVKADTAKKSVVKADTAKKPVVKADMKKTPLTAEHPAAASALVHPAKDE
jgi:amylosucrase